VRSRINPFVRRGWASYSSSGPMVALVCMECDSQGLPCSRDMGWVRRVLENTGEHLDSGCVLQHCRAVATTGDRPFADVSASDGALYLA